MSFLAVFLSLLSCVLLWFITAETSPHLHLAQLSTSVCFAHDNPFSSSFPPILPPPTRVVDLHSWGLCFGIVSVVLCLFHHEIYFLNIYFQLRFLPTPMCPFCPHFPASLFAAFNYSWQIQILGVFPCLDFGYSLKKSLLYFNVIKPLKSFCLWKQVCSCGCVSMYYSWVNTQKRVYCVRKPNVNVPSKIKTYLNLKKRLWIKSHLFSLSAMQGFHNIGNLFWLCWWTKASWTYH